MPDVDKKEPRYRIDPELFLATWYEAMQEKPKPWTMAKFIEVLKERCDRDERNAGASRKWTEASMKAKMDYYNRSWGMTIEKPEMKKKDSKDQRQARRAKYTEMFLQAGMATKKEAK